MIPGCAKIFDNAARYDVLDCDIRHRSTLWSDSIVKSSRRRLRLVTSSSHSTRGT
jgi:hypothetical protein